MAEHLTVKYGTIGDILYIHKVTPHKEQDSDEIGDGIIARFNPDTGEIENLEILFFAERIKESGSFDLPIAADLRLVVRAS